MPRRAATRGGGARGAAGRAAEATSPPAERTASEVRRLSRKYAQLAAKYRRLVALREGRVEERSATVLLALAAMRAGRIALAAWRDGRYLARNGAWFRLACTRGVPWHRADPDARRGGAELSKLEDLTARVAATLDDRPGAAAAALYERGDGQAFADVRLERIKMGKGPTLVLATVADVTERVRDERQLASMRETLLEQERLRAIGELASGVAHDLNNTFHALGLRLGNLREGSADRQENLRTMQRIVADAAERVRRLQDVAGRREDRPDELVELGTVIAQATEVVRPELEPGPARDGRVRVEIDVPPLPAVTASGAELRHVLVSLLLNARDAMPAGGRIRMTGRRVDDGGVEVEVTDEGTGIPEGLAARIFEPFFTTKGRRGTGLGLSIASGVMRRLGGSIRAANRPEGGAVLTLRFPAARAVPAPRSAAPADAAPAPSRRVLVVDDDPDNLEAMQLALEHYGHRADVTSSGLDAVARVEGGERYDLVLCDLGLGDLNGWDVAARIGAAAPGLEVFLVTGWADEIPDADPRRRQVAGVLGKPLDAGALKALLRREHGGVEDARRPSSTAVPGRGQHVAAP